MPLLSESTASYWKPVFNAFGRASTTVLLALSVLPLPIDTQLPEAPRTAPALGVW